MATEPGKPDNFHRRFFERNLPIFAIVSTLAIAVGGLVEIIPMFTVTLGPEKVAGVTPYTPLEVAGRDIYIREGCYTCHSQMVRPMRAEMLRYGEWSRAGEYAYDHPFLLGSRRIGPDLQREGGKYPDSWHYEHMRNPRSLSPGSLMPTYAWLHRNTLDPEDIRKSVIALRRVGVPYTDADVANVPAQMAQQGGEIVGRLASAGIKAEPTHEIIALIAYLQRLGRDGRAAIAAQAAAPAPMATQ